MSNIGDNMTDLIIGEINNLQVKSHQVITEDRPSTTEVYASSMTNYQGGIMNNGSSFAQISDREAQGNQAGLTSLNNIPFGTSAFANSSQSAHPNNSSPEKGARNGEKQQSSQSQTGNAGGVRMKSRGLIKLEVITDSPFTRSLQQGGGGYGGHERENQKGRSLLNLKRVVMEKQRQKYVIMNNDLNDILKDQINRFFDNINPTEWEDELLSEIIEQVSELSAA